MNLHSLYDQRRSFFLTPSAAVRGGLIFCIVIGILTFIGGMYAGEATRTWGSYLFNLIFFFLIALGGSALVGMQDVIGAGWGRSIIRLQEAFVSFLPVAFAAFVVLFLCIWFDILGAGHLYKWIADPTMLKDYWGKRTWLQEVPFLLRDTAAIGVIMLLALWQVGQKVKRDMALVQGETERAKQLGVVAQQRLRHWSAPIMVVYALLLTMLSFDLTSSLAPTWYSTLWGGWEFAVLMQTTLAALFVFMYLMRGTGLGQMMKRQQFHDVGKLLYGFTIFFAYITYAHILTYWYGDVPEETSYYLLRLREPWLVITLVAPFLVFVIPLFAFIPKAAKWNASWALPLGILILVAQWLIGLLIVIPETVPDPSTWRVPWIELGGFFFFFGLFLGSIFWFGRRFPMLAIADPILERQLASEHH